MRKILLLVFLFSTQSLAAQELCYQSENNPRTGRIFQNEGDYDQEISYWNSKHPGMPNPFSLIKAYSVYSSLKKYAESLKTKSDKLAHCYVGCRIAQETNLHTADYVGWLKEDKDLKDCVRGTRFDEDDYVATVRGAEFASSQKEATGCLDSCSQVYSSR